MKTLRLIALLALAVAAACADPVTAPVTADDAGARMSSGQGFMGGGTR